MTQVVDHKAYGDGAYEELVGSSVGAPEFVVVTELPVADRS